MRYRECQESSLEVHSCCFFQRSRSRDRLIEAGQLVILANLLNQFSFITIMARMKSINS